MDRKQKVLVIVGPTASGKSALAVRLARKFNGEIISADSRQVYRGLDIGTGKIIKNEMCGVPHHLLDVVPPKKTFTAHDFVVRAQRAIAQIVRKGNMPIIVGGTGFYIDALVGRITLPDVPANPKLRARLEKKSAPQLFALLKMRDSKRAKTIEPKNKRRLIRALEIVAAQGQVYPRSDLESSKSDLEVLWLGLAPTSEQLERKIRIRLFARMRAGMLAEARRLHVHGLSYRRMGALGLEYRWLARLLQKKVTRAEFEERLFRDIRRYARKQKMYWKRNKDIRWFSSTDNKHIEPTIRRWLKK